MSKIESLKKDKVIDNGLDTIDYFINDNENSSLKDYQIIIDKIKNAKEKIVIQSTRSVSDEIIDALYQNNEIHIYMILKSFEESKRTLDRFDKRKPAVIREVMEIKNDFIIIDGFSYLFINPLSNGKNIYVALDEKKTKDIGFIFNYYFWNCASVEKLVDTIGKPTESPFPPFEKREQSFMNIIDIEWSECQSIYIPRDKKFEALLEKQSDYKYFSDDIQKAVLIKDDSLQIGKIQLNDMTLDIDNRWLLKSSSLKNIDIDLDIVIKDRDWNTTLNIKNSQDKDLGDIEAKTIEAMETTGPDVFPKIEFIKEITYIWNVKPPSKPKDAKKSSLYSEYDRLEKEFNQQLGQLERNLENLKQESSVLSSFIGTNRKASQNLKKIEEYRSIDLRSMKSIDLENLIEKEFKDFYNEIVKSQDGFIEDKKRADEEKKWNTVKKEKNEGLDRKTSELAQEKAKLEKAGQDKQRDKLTKNIQRLENEIDRGKKEIENNYTSFAYKPQENELKHLSRNDFQQYKALKLPKYVLPEVGELYEAKHAYFLEITSLEDIDKANELKERYDDKNEYKVVVGDINE